MKKLLILFVSITIIFCSCSVEKNLFRSEKDVVDEYFGEIITGINNGDIKKITNQFSELAISKTTSFDIKAKELIDFIKGNIAEYTARTDPTIFKIYNDDGTGRSWKRARIVYDIETTETSYSFAVQIYLKDNRNSKNIGVYSIYVFEAGTPDSNFVEDEDSWIPGINIVEYVF